MARSEQATLADQFAGLEAGDLEIRIGTVVDPAEALQDERVAEHDRAVALLDRQRPYRVVRPAAARPFWTTA